MRGEFPILKFTSAHTSNFFSFRAKRADASADLGSICSCARYLPMQTLIIKNPVQQNDIQVFSDMHTTELFSKILLSFYFAANILQVKSARQRLAYNARCRQLGNAESDSFETLLAFFLCSKENTFSSLIDPMTYQKTKVKESCLSEKGPQTSNRGKEKLHINQHCCFIAL